MKMLKHVRIFVNNQFWGRYALRTEKEQVFLKKLAGANLPARWLIPLLASIECGQEDLYDIALELYRSRKNPLRVNTRKGASGCIDFVVERLYDEVNMETRRGLPLRVSMREKLNETFAIWLGDIPAIGFHDLFPEWGIDLTKREGVSFKVTTPPQRKEFTPPFGEDENNPHLAV